MKRIKQTILLILALFCFMEAFPQGKLVIRGRVIDKSDKSTVIGANIIEFDNENRVINGTITNVNGDFVLEMRNSANNIRVVFGRHGFDVRLPDFALTIKYLF